MEASREWTRRLIINHLVRTYKDCENPWWADSVDGGSHIIEQAKAEALQEIKDLKMDNV